MTDTTHLDHDNLAFQHAVSFVNQTNRLIFLTGRAGTGKTTFLRYIRQHSHKKMVVAAPTGVAAMNAGGMTLHSLFWLPFGLYVPQDFAGASGLFGLPDRSEQTVGPGKAGSQGLPDAGSGVVYDKRRLFGKVKLTTRKRALLREIELLVIDEVSMVRADVLDAIDAILKSVRRDARPFGGLQVLFIGDLYQLPPVVKEYEWRIMEAYYKSPFFFDAHVLKDHPPVLLELEKVYRQRDADFIGLLNAIRNNTCSPDQLDQLNGYYQPDFVPAGEETYITLTSHNNRADEINRRALAALPGNSVTLSARIKGDFSSALYPAETDLELKVGAQVMFIRNDSGEDRKYYNGKIGQIQHIDSSGDSLIVGFPDRDEETVEVKREIWENIRYDYDKDKDRIHEDVLGTFSQFPLRLAWAITIHKSQGLTFDRAIIDAGASFAAGQVYVALSRLTSLEGLVLKSRIPLHSIRTDQVVLDFSASTAREEELPGMLADSQRDYLGHILLESFKWGRLLEVCNKLLDDLENRNIADQAQAYRFLEVLKLAVEAQEEVANKFRNQLIALLRSGEQAGKPGADYSKILERTSRAVEWFGPRMDEQLIAGLEKHMEEWAAKKRTKRYVSDLSNALAEFRRKKEQLMQCLDIAENLAKSVSLPA